MLIINREKARVINTPHGSEIRPLVDRTTSAIKKCSLAEEVLPAGAAVGRHFHRETEEIYYILAGSARMHLGEEQQTVGPGDAIAISPGQVHQIHNTGREMLVFLCCCAPGYEHRDTMLVEDDCGPRRDES